MITSVTMFAVNGISSSEKGDQKHIIQLFGVNT